MVMETISKSDAWAGTLTVLWYRVGCFAGCLAEGSGLFARASAGAGLTAPSYAERAKGSQAAATGIEPELIGAARRLADVSKVETVSGSMRLGADRHHQGWLRRRVRLAEAVPQDMIAMPLGPEGLKYDRRRRWVDRRIRRRCHCLSLQVPVDELRWYFSAADADESRAWDLMTVSIMTVIHDCVSPFALQRRAARALPRGCDREASSSYSWLFGSC
jgi:hypothetical protein